MSLGLSKLDWSTTRPMTTGVSTPTLLPINEFFPLTQFKLAEENNTNAFWDILQMATSIFCACAPMYKTLLPLQDVWRRLKTSVATWASRTRLHGPLPKFNKSSVEERNSTGQQDGSSPPESGNWPRLVGGSQTQYTWSEVETVDIQLPVQHQMKGSHGSAHNEIV